MTRVFLSIRMGMRSLESRVLREWIQDADRAVALSVIEVLGIDHRRFQSLCRGDDGRIPIADPITLRYLNRDHDKTRIDHDAWKYGKPFDPAKSGAPAERLCWLAHDVD